MGSGPFGAGGRDVRGRTDRLRSVSGVERCWDPVPGRGAVKVAEASGERVKTDAKDAIHLARLLRLDEITLVSIPSVDQEAARDLVRAREDCSGDLMRARHRLSKLLLRHGIVYYGRQAWTGKHEAWLRHEALPQLTTRATRLTFDSGHDNVLTVKVAVTASTSRSARWPPIRSSPTWCTGWGACVGSAPQPGSHWRSKSATGTAHWQHHRLVRRTRAQRVLLGVLAGAGVDHQGRRHPRAPAPGRSCLASPSPLHRGQDHARPLGWLPPQHGIVATRATGDCTNGG